MVPFPESRCQVRLRSIVLRGLRLPLSQIKERQSEIPRDPARPVLLICRTQNRSSKLAAMLQAQGYTNVSYVDGGMKEWTGRHFATEAPPPR